MYDGFVFPNEDWWDKINNFLLDTGLKTKDSYGCALKMFLKTIDLDILGFDILGTLKTVQIIYFQLRHKSYLLYNDPKKVTHFSCTDHLDKGLQQVLIYHFIVHLWLVIHIHFLSVSLVSIILNKNTWGVKKCGANQKQHCKQAGATKKFDIS